MTKTADGGSILEQVANVLIDEWDETLENKSELETRGEPVPTPTITWQAREDDRSQNYGPSSGDVITVLDGGDEDVSASGLGWRSRKREVKVDIEMRTSQGLKRYSGGNVSGNYNGLTGETQRIFDKYRNGGLLGYDMVEKRAFADQTADYGAGTWVGMWKFTLRTWGEEIEQPAYVRSPGGN